MPFRCLQSPGPGSAGRCFAHADPALGALLTAMVRRKYPAGGTRESKRNRSQDTTSAAQALPAHTQIVSNRDERGWSTSSLRPAPRVSGTVFPSKTCAGAEAAGDVMAESLPQEVRGGCPQARLATGPALRVLGCGEGLSDGSLGPHCQAETTCQRDPRT